MHAVWLRQLRSRAARYSSKLAYKQLTSYAETVAYEAMGPAGAYAITTTTSARYKLPDSIKC